MRKLWWTTPFLAVALALGACGDNTIPALCGNGHVDPGETCDRGATDPNLACPSTCADPCETVQGAAATCSAECVVKTTSTAGDSCCLPGSDQTTDSDCAATCGNGVLESGEMCDIGIAQGTAGSCPLSCDDAMACTTDSLAGVGCAAACVNTPITAPVDGDGCCPLGENFTTDSDCPIACGNGIVDPGETCDEAIAAGDPGACPTAADCDDADDCTSDTLVGGSCTQACSHVADTPPSGTTADACCPGGANANTDVDCAAICGNGALEPGESCEIGIMGSCPTSIADCDDGDPCTTAAFGGVDCAAACSQTTTTTPSGSTSDACCPAAGDANNDVDCLAVCGNSRVEPNAGEACDIGIASGFGACPASAADCSDGNTCTTDAPTGAGCGTTCASTAVTTCGADGCCVAGCVGDPDCSTTCGNGTVQAGETCDTAIAAGSPGACPTVASCNDSDACTNDALQSAGTCNAVCVHSDVTTASGSTADGCCPLGADSTNDADCTPGCGNGVVEAGETCDTAIAAGSPGACPTSCADTNACTNDVLQNGGTCQAACSFVAFTPCCGDGIVTASDETCDTAIATGSGKCPTAPATDCNDSNACTNDTISQPGNACTATCVNTAFTPCCGDGVVTSPTTLTETCDTAIPSGPGSCSAITCADNYSCTADSSTNLGGNACRKICIHSAVNNTTTSDSCCPPQSRFGDDIDCLCGNAVTNGPATAPFEQCDDGNTVNVGDACTNSCTLDAGVAVGSPCSLPADCTFVAPTAAGLVTCISPSSPPVPETQAVVNGYCSVAFCDTTTTDTNGNLVPENIESCPQLIGPAMPNSICVSISASLPNVCAALCNPAHGDAECRHTESNPALGAAGTYAYRCTPISPTAGICLPRNPAY